MLGEQTVGIGLLCDEKFVFSTLIGGSATRCQRRAPRPVTSWPFLATWAPILLWLHRGTQYNPNPERHCPSKRTLNPVWENRKQHQSLRNGASHCRWVGDAICCISSSTTQIASPISFFLNFLILFLSSVAHTDYAYGVQSTSGHKTGPCSKLTIYPQLFDQSSTFMCQRCDPISTYILMNYPK